MAAAPPEPGERQGQARAHQRPPAQAAGPDAGAAGGRALKRAARPHRSPGPRVAGQHVDHRRAGFIAGERPRRRCGGEGPPPARGEGVVHPADGVDGHLLRPRAGPRQPHAAALDERRQRLRTRDGQVGGVDRPQPGALAGHAHGVAPTAVRRHAQPRPREQGRRTAGTVVDVHLDDGLPQSQRSGTTRVDRAELDLQPTGRGAVTWPPDRDQVVPSRVREGRRGRRTEFAREALVRIVDETLAPCRRQQERQQQGRGGQRRAARGGVHRPTSAVHQSTSARASAAASCCACGPGPSSGQLASAMPAWRKGAG